MAKKNLEDTLLDELSKLDRAAATDEVEPEVTDKVEPESTDTVQPEVTDKVEDTETSIIDKFISGDKDAVRDLVHQHVIRTVSSMINNKDNTTVTTDE